MSTRMKQTKAENELLLAAVVTNPVSSEIFQDILKKENIPFICRQYGAGAYFKILAGPAAAPDYIYVSRDDFERAKELYEAYLTTEAETEFLDFSE